MKVNDKHKSINGIFNPIEDAEQHQQWNRNGFCRSMGPLHSWIRNCWPLGAIGGALIGNKLARAIDLGDPNGKYTGEK